MGCLLWVYWPLQWRHNGHDSVSDHQPHVCLLNRLFRRRSKKTSKLRVTGLCAGNSPEAGEFPAQMASNEENVSFWWRHHGQHTSDFELTNNTPKPHPHNWVVWCILVANILKESVLTNAIPYLNLTRQIWVNHIWKSWKETSGNIHTSPSWGSYRGVICEYYREKWPH